MEEQCSVWGLRCAGVEPAYNNLQPFHLYNDDIAGEMGPGVRVQCPGQQFIYDFSLDLKAEVQVLVHCDCVPNCCPFLLYLVVLLCAKLMRTVGGRNASHGHQELG